MSPLITWSVRQRRQFDKECFGDEIANKLNGAMPSPSVLRVRTLIERLKACSEKSAQLESIRRERGLMRMDVAGALARSPLCDYELSDPEVSELAAQIEKIAGELSQQLGRYLWRPNVQVNPDGSIRQVIRWSHVNEESAWENATVHWLISELPASPQDKGPFAPFTHCERCGNWFYAGREGAKFCRAACRVMSHAQTDTGRSERALYMRKLRAQERERREKKAQPK